MPFISVILPVYNGLPFLEKAVDSVLQQTMMDFEFIIIDDASTDKSFEVLKTFTDCRIILLKNPKNLGLISTLNLGLSMAKGEYIARMDQDDICRPNRFEVQYAFMQANPDVTACGAFAKIIDTDEVVQYPTESMDIKIALLEKNVFVHPTMFFRRKELLELGMQYDINYKSAEDYHLFYKLSYCSKVVNLETVLLDYRIHKSQISTADAGTQKETADKVRIDVIEKFLDRTLDNDEKKLHLNYLFARKCEIPIQAIKKWVKRLIRANYKKQIYPNDLFVFFLEEKFKRCVKSYYLWNKPTLNDIYCLFCNLSLLRYMGFRVWASVFKRVILNK